MRVRIIIPGPHFVILNEVKNLTQGIEPANSLSINLRACVRPFAVCAAQDDNARKREEMK